MSQEEEEVLFHCEPLFHDSLLINHSFVFKYKDHDDNLITKRLKNIHTITKKYDHSLQCDVDAWPGSILGCELISNNIHWIENKDILEIGCGTGLPGICCSFLAKSVIVSDHPNSDVIDTINYIKHENNKYKDNMDKIIPIHLDWCNSNASNTNTIDSKYDFLILSELLWEQTIQYKDDLFHMTNRLLKLQGEAIILWSDRETSTHKKEDNLKFIELFQKSNQYNVTHLTTKDMKDIISEDEEGEDNKSKTIKVHAYHVKKII